MDRLAETNQAPETIKASKAASNFETPRLVLRPSSAQAWLVVTNDDIIICSPHLRSDVGVVAVSCVDHILTTTSFDRTQTLSTQRVVDTLRSEESYFFHDNRLIICL